MKRGKMAACCHSSRLLFFYSILYLRFGRIDEVEKVASLFAHVEGDETSYVENIRQRSRDLAYALDTYRDSMRGLTS